MEDIAREAGVARGLLNHYFGSRRELYLEVVRSMLTIPTDLFPTDRDGGDPEQLLGDAVDRYLDMVSAYRGTWLATLGAEGFGRDPDLEAIIEAAREQSTDGVVSMLRPREDPDSAPRELRALIRAYAGFVERASLEWLQRERLNRAQMRELLVRGLLVLWRDVLPGVELLAGAERGTA
jgi:AcrR family transcriptional regulator